MKNKCKVYYNFVCLCVIQKNITSNILVATWMTRASHYADYMDHPHSHCETRQSNTKTNFTVTLQELGQLYQLSWFLNEVHNDENMGTELLNSLSLILQPHTLIQSVQSKQTQLAMLLMKGEYDENLKWPFEVKSYYWIGRIHRSSRRT